MREIVLRFDADQVEDGLLAWARMKIAYRPLAYDCEHLVVRVTQPISSATPQILLLALIVPLRRLD